MNIIETLRNSGNKLLETEAQDLAKWSKLKHTKQDFELFLNFNLAEVRYRTVKGEQHNIICTSNTTLIKLFSIVKEKEKKQIQFLKSNGIKTPDIDSVDTWDLVENKRKTIKLNSWAIQNFISITPENILIINDIIQKLLRS